VSVLLIFVQLWMRARYASHSGRGSMGEPWCSRAGCSWSRAYRMKL